MRNDLRETIVAAHQSGKVYMVFSMHYRIYKCYTKVENIQDNFPRSGHPFKFSQVQPMQCSESQGVVFHTLLLHFEFLLN